MATCKALTAKGTPCQKKALANGYCNQPAHQPDQVPAKEADEKAVKSRARLRLPSRYQAQLDIFKENNPRWELEDIAYICQMEIDLLGVDVPESGKRQNWARIAADVAKSIEARGTLIDDKLEVHIHVPQTQTHTHD